MKNLIKNSYEARNGKPRSRRFKKYMGFKAIQRRQGALNRLENQLALGTKQDGEPLAEGDVLRIQKEIEIIKKKL